MKSRSIRTLVASATALSLVWSLAGAVFAAGNDDHDKVTVCHHTGSATNPLVEITIARNALAAHMANHGDDTVGDCPPPVAPAVAPDTAAAKAGSDENAGGAEKHEANGGVNAAVDVSHGASDNGDHKVTICHHTGSTTNPIVEITIDKHTLDAHMANHGDDTVLTSGASCTAPAGSEVTAGGSVAGVENEEIGTSNPLIIGSGVEAAALAPSEAVVSVVAAVESGVEAAAINPSLRAPEAPGEGVAAAELSPAAAPLPMIAAADQPAAVQPAEESPSPSLLPSAGDIAFGSLMASLAILLGTALIGIGRIGQWLSLRKR